MFTSDISTFRNSRLSTPIRKEGTDISETAFPWPSVFNMFKRDDYLRTKPDAVFSQWQGFAGSMLLRKPFSENAELRRDLADYNSISRDFGPKIPIGANNKEDFRKGKIYAGRYRVQGSIQGLGVAVMGHGQGQKVDPNDVLVASHGQTESIRTRLRSYGRSIPHHDLLMSQRNPGVSQTILPSSQKKISNRAEDKKDESAEEREISCDGVEDKSTSPVSVLGLRSDDIVDGYGSVFVCGVILEDGTACTTTPIKGRKRCTEHKGQRISSVPPEKHIPSEAPRGRECDETENICGVILPDMVRCRTKPVSRRKRCEEHKGMRVNAFFFLLNPTERDKAVKEEKSKPETRKGSVNQEDSSPSLLCEATMKNGLPCTRIAPQGSARCWQHKDQTLDKRSSENVESATIGQVICGVKLYNGSVCEKPPVKGRKRCEEHKGMRITS